MQSVQLHAPERQITAPPVLVRFPERRSIRRDVVRYHAKPDQAPNDESTLLACPLLGTTLRVVVRRLIFPALLHRFPNTLRVLLSVIFVQVGCLDVGGGARVRIVE